jgi:hypothetical protein
LVSYLKYENRLKLIDRFCRFGRFVHDSLRRLHAIHVNRPAPAQIQYWRIKYTSRRLPQIVYHSLPANSFGLSRVLSSILFDTYFPCVLSRFVSRPTPPPFRQYSPLPTKSLFPVVNHLAQPRLSTCFSITLLAYQCWYMYPLTYSRLSFLVKFF